jgi:hypothetical protein
LGATLAKAAAASADLSKLKWLHLDQKCQLPIDITDSAAGTGAIAVLKWLKQQGCAFDINTMNAAVKGQHISALQFLLEEGCCIGNDKTCAVAAGTGTVAVLQWLREHGCSWDVCSISAHAVSSRSIDMMIWVRLQGIQLRIRLMQIAASAGDTAMIEYLISEGCPLQHATNVAAAAGNYVDSLIWLKQHSPLWDWPYVCIRTAQSGATESITWLLQQQIDAPAIGRSTLLTYMLDAAGRYGQLAAAKLIKKAGARWPDILLGWQSNTRAWAVREGYLLGAHGFYW